MGCPLRGVKDMPLLQWRDEFSVGIADVDHEHRELIALINELVERMTGGGPEAPVLDYFGEVHAKIAAHFALEEKIMRDRNYDQYADHKADHDRLLDELREIMDAYEDGELPQVDELAGRLERWFGEHFRTRDARLHQLLSSA